jgi:D-sedoheptulose 7-phosphate isomerase
VNTNAAHASTYLAQTAKIAGAIDPQLVEELVAHLAALREGNGRLFILGVGGGAGHAGHAVNDFRKLCQIEAYAPTDNVSELTARTNDEGFETVFSAFLQISKAGPKDGLLIFSVGGGNVERNVSVNLIRAVDEAKRRGMKIFGIVGRDGGYVKREGDVVIVIPTVDEALVTPHTEAFQAVVWHCLVSHPKLQQIATKW